MKNLEGLKARAKALRLHVVRFSVQQCVCAHVSDAGDDSSTTYR